MSPSDTEQIPAAKNSRVARFQDIMMLSPRDQEEARSGYSAHGIHIGRYGSRGVRSATRRTGVSSRKFSVAQNLSKGWS